MRHSLKTISKIIAACFVGLVALVEILWYGGNPQTPNAWKLARKDNKK